MSYIGSTPANKLVTSSDMEDGIVTTSKIADDAATADKIANAVNSAISANTSKTTNATHSGEVTGSGALTIADNVVDEANLKVSNSAVNGYMLTAQSGNTGGLTWTEAGGGKVHQAKSNVNTSVVSSSNNMGGNDMANNGAVSNGTQVCTITITPVSSTSHFFCWFSSANGMTADGKGVTGIFVGSSLINVASSNGYGGDIDGQTCHGIFDNSNTNQVVIQARNLGTTDGSTNYTNADAAGNANHKSRATLTVIEIED